MRASPLLPPLLAALAAVAMGANDDAGCGRGAAPTPGTSDVSAAPDAAPDAGTGRGACETAADCEAAGLIHPACVGSFSCEDGACVYTCDEAPIPPGSGCFSDLDCPAEARCNANDVCLPPPGCDGSGPCPDVCYGQCVPKEEPYCQSSQQCPSGTHCSTEDGDCLSACPPDAVCPAVCSGRCVPDTAPPPEGCMSDADCHDGRVCNAAETCRPAPCPEGEVCDMACRGTCVPPQPTCTSSEQCGPREHCSTEDGECLSPCREGETCVDVCAGHCVPDPVCFSDDACPMNAFCDFGGCGGAPGALVACAGTCAPRPRCSDSSQCRPGDVCTCAPPGFALPNAIVACEMMCLPESAECYADPDCGPGRICHAFACEAAPVQCWAESDCADGWECVVDCTQLPQPPDPGGRMACPAFCQPKAPPEEPACGIDGLTCPDGTVCGCDPNGDGSTCVPACLPEAPVPPPWDCRDDADCGGGGFCQVVVCADPICDAAGVCTGGGCYGHCRAPYDCATDADCASGSCLRDQTTCTAEDDCKGWCQDTPPATCEGDCDCRLDQTCHRGADGVGTCRHLGTRNSCDWLGCRSDAECARGETCAIMCPSCMPGALCPPCTGTCFASQR